MPLIGYTHQKILPRNTEGCGYIYICCRTELNTETDSERVGDIIRPSRLQNFGKTDSKN